MCLHIQNVDCESESLLLLIDSCSAITMASSHTLAMLSSARMRRSTSVKQMSKFEFSWKTMSFQVRVVDDGLVIRRLLSPLGND